MLKSLILFTLLAPAVSFSAKTSLVDTLENTVFRTTECSGPGRYYINCFDKFGTASESFYDIASVEELAEMIENRADFWRVTTLSCDYQIDFQGNWCQINGVFEADFSGEEATGKAIKRSSWDE